MATIVAYSRLGGEEGDVDRAALLRHLEQAERHVALGVQHLTRQRQIIMALRRGGADITEAVKLLDNMEVSQALHIAGRDRLLNQLASIRKAL